MVKDVGTLAVYLTMPRDDFQKGVKEAQRDIGKLSTAIGVFAIGAAASLTAFAVKSINAFSEQEDAINNMDAALSAAGDNVNKYSSKFQKFASEMQSKTIFGDEQVLGVMAYGKAMGIAADQIEDAGRAAIGLAAKYNIDLQTAIGLIARANLGNTTMLKRYGVVLDESMTKEQKFAALLKIGGDSFGLAEAKTKTYSGALAQLKNNFGEIEEAIGKMISESLSLTSKIGVLSNIALKTAEYLGKLDDTTKSVIVKITALAAGVITLASSYKFLNFFGLIPSIASLGKAIPIMIAYTASVSAGTVATNNRVTAIMGEIAAQKALDAARMKSAASNATVGLGQAGGLGRVFAVGPSTPFGAGTATIQSAAVAAQIKAAGNVSMFSKAVAGLGIASTATGNALSKMWVLATGPIGIVAAIAAVGIAYRKELSEWLVGVKSVQNKSDELDEKIKALPALGSRGIISGMEAVKNQAVAAKKYLEEILEPSAFNAEMALNVRKLQDEIKIAGMADESLQEKLLIIAEKRNQIIRESTNVINSTGDAIKDQEAEEKRLQSLREADVRLQIEKNKLIEEERKKTLDAQISYDEKLNDIKFKNATTLDEKLKLLADKRIRAELNATYAKDEATKLKYEGESADIEQEIKDLKKASAGKSNQYVAPRLSAAVEKGTVEAYRAEISANSQDTALFQKTEKNTEQTAKGVNQLVQSFKPFANMGVA
ncbi:MAG: hypothetical protein WCX65_19845 [bacterium]